jgi:ArsR family transcriptional regulator
MEPAMLFRVLSDPHRLAILLALARAQKPICVCDFASAVKLDQSTVSHHLKLLREAGLVGARRRGTWAYYTLTNGTRERLHSVLDSVLSPQISA